jgi:hypothetical protein
VANSSACSRSAATLFVFLLEGFYELAHEIWRHEAILQAAEDASLNFVPANRRYVAAGAL